MNLAGGVSWAEVCLLAGVFMGGLRRLALREGRGHPLQRGPEVHLGTPQESLGTGRQPLRLRGESHRGEIRLGKILALE